MKSKKPLFVANCQGFTLVELMITLAMAGIIVAAIYAAYNIQQKTYFTQGQVVEMQQNIRAGLEMISSEVRMAGYDPGGKAGASITTATASKFAFTADLTGGPDGKPDGDTNDANEQVVFCLKAMGADPADADGCDVDGIAVDEGTAAVIRNTQGIAEGIQAIEFYYTQDDGVTKTLTPAIDKIQSVQITLLAVASQRDSKYTNTDTYATAWSSDPAHLPVVYPTLSAPPWGPYDDNFRRRLLTTTVNLRNHGLNK